MANPTSGNDSPVTTGSEQRPARRLGSASFMFQLSEEFRSLKEEPAWSAGDRNARTLVHEEGLRVMLLALKVGARLEEHQTRSWVSIAVQHGSVRVGLPDETLVAHAGNVIVLRHGVPHSVEAVEESGLVLTFTAPLH